MTEGQDQAWQDPGSQVTMTAQPLVRFEFGL